MSIVDIMLEIPDEDLHHEAPYKTESI
jgi:hypothetical protein